MNTFLEEVKKMSLDDIFEAIEQESLYTDDEITFLKQELDERYARGEKSRIFNNEDKEKLEIILNKRAYRQVIQKEIKEEIKEEILLNKVLNNIPKDKNNNVFWTKFLRRYAILNLICGIIISIIIFIIEFSKDFLVALGGGLAYASFTIILTASVMVFVEMSENTAKNTENTTKIIEILNNKH